MEQVELTDVERRQSLIAAICCVAVFGITVAVMSPLISLILEARGTDRTTIGLMASVPAISLLATNPLIPTLVRVLGMRRFIFGCMTLQLVLVLLMPVFDNLGAWFILRGLTGAAINGLFVASETWINVVAEERNRGRVLALYGTVLSGSFALGPLVIAVTGTEGWPPFLAVAGLIVVAGLPLARSGQISPMIKGRASFGVIAFFWLAPTLTAAVFLSSFKEMSMSALLPVFGVRSGLSEGSAAALLTAGYCGALLAQFPIGWCADRMNRYRLLIILLAIALIGACALPSIIAQGGVTMWLGVAVVIGLSSGLYVVAMTLVGQRFRGADLVAANSAFGVLWGLGSLTGPALSGVAMDLWDPEGFVGPLVVVAFVALAIAIVRQRTRN